MIRSGTSNRSNNSIHSGNSNKSNEYKYKVLYSKRSTRSNKSKGTTRRLDGILSIAPPPLSTVTLIDDDNDDNNKSRAVHGNMTDDDYDEEEEEEDEEEEAEDSDEEEELKGMSYQKRMQAIRKKRNNCYKQKQKKKKAKTKKSSFEVPSRSNSPRRVVFSVKDVGVAKRALDQGGLKEDDVVHILQWECLILSSFLSTANVPSTSHADAAAGGTFPTKSSIVMNRRRRPTLTSKISTGRPMVLVRRTIKQEKNHEGIYSDVDNRVNSSMKRNSCMIKQGLPSQNTLLPLTDATKLRTSLEKRKVLMPKRNIMSMKNARSKSASMIHPRSIVTNASNQTSGDLVFPEAVGTIQLPNSIKSILRPHQRDGVTFLWNCLTGKSATLKSVVQERIEEESAHGRIMDDALEETRSKMGRGAILADEMGLGKTLMTISIIFATHRTNRNDRFIIVCPSSLVSNWANEFDKWVGRAMQPKRVVVRKGGEEGLGRIKAFVPVKPNKVEVLIISYDLFRINISTISQARNIGLLVVDEGHRLKNSAGSLTLSALNSLHCDARLLITGTPIQNCLSEFHNIANFVCPGILGDLHTFRHVYERPLMKANDKDATISQKEESKTIERKLETITSSFMIRRLQKDVLKSLLPPKSEILLFCRPSLTQCHFYKKLADECLRGDLSLHTSSTDTLKILTQVRKLCSHPSLLEEYSQSHTETTASNDVAESGKLIVLQNLLTSIRFECSGDKVVIVSNFTSALSLIETMVLQESGWSFLRLDGAVEQSSRQIIIDSFNRGSVENSFVLLLSSKAGGCGLNLIGANRLVMFDPDWNPATDMQAMARVYRQGQTKKCFIYRFFTSGTIEEVIYQRQLHKRNLDNLAMDSSRRNLNQFTKEELQDCFTLKEGCDCDTKQKIGKNWTSYDKITDSPLLGLSHCKCLSFVHLVDDASTQPTTIQSDESSASETRYCANNNAYYSSENEFDG